MKNLKDYTVTLRVVTEYIVTVEASSLDYAADAAIDAWQDLGIKQWQDADILRIEEAL